MKLSYGITVCKEDVEIQRLVTFLLEHKRVEDEIVITYDSKNRIVFSDFKTKIIDKDGNHIFLEMFNYYVDTNIFFSKD